MATAADVMFAQLQQDEQNKIFEQQRKQQSQLEKRRGRMGIGRLIGAAAGGLLGLATGGGSLLITGALAGLGSRAGSGIGGRVAVDDIEVGKLYQEQAKRARTEGIQAQRDLVRSANVGALSDAFSAYTLAGTSFGQGAQRFVKNPVQFTKNMFGQAQAPASVVPNTMAMPNINFNSNQRLNFLNTAARNNAYLSPTNIAQARGMLNPDNVVQQVGGNLRKISTPMFSAAADVTNTYNAMDTANITPSGVNFTDEPILIGDLFNQFLGGSK